MKLLVLNYEYPPLGGGAGNATYFLCREWEKAGMSVDIVTTWYRGLPFVHNESEKMTVHRVKSLRKNAEQSTPLEMLSYIGHGYGKARILCRNNRYDLIIGFFSIPSGVIAYRLFQKHHVPYIVLLRGGDVPGFLPDQLRLFHLITMPFTKRIWRCAKRVFANSRGLQRLADATGKRIGVAIDFAPNGVDADFYCPAGKPSRPDFVFLFAGRFSAQKNLCCLLEVFGKSAGAQGARLILVGDGPERQRLEKMIGGSKTLSASVLLRPWCSKENLRRHYREASCFVNPSLYEGLPNSLLEAMACGLPVIASDIGGNNELVSQGENGFLFDVADPATLGNRMLDMMHATTLDAFGIHSRRRVVRDFSWNAAAARIMEG